MIGMRMGLEAILDIVQGTTVHERRRHNVGAEINEQIIVDQRSGPFSQTRPT
jgi:hypothetical protein